MKTLRRPLTLNAPSRGVLPVVSDEPPSFTPVVSSASDEYSRDMQRQRARLVAGDDLAALAGVGLDAAATRP